jgi:2,5-diketo-D-gluconate reductase A
MPMIGLGTWPFLADEARATVSAALEARYRLIDTSEQYGNEGAVGQAIRDSGVAREEIFLTTKFDAEWHGEQLVQRPTSVRWNGSASTTPTSSSSTGRTRGSTATSMPGEV